MSDIGDRTGAHRAASSRARRSQTRVGVELGELSLFPANPDDSHRRSGCRRIRRNRFRRCRNETRDAVEDVVAPGAAVRCGAHRLAEFAIVRNIDACRLLSEHDLAHGGSQARLQRFFRKTTRLLRPHFAQVGRPWKTADMRGQNSLSASSHLSIPPRGYWLPFEPIIIRESVLSVRRTCWETCLPNWTNLGSRIAINSTCVMRDLPVFRRDLAPKSRKVARRFPAQV